MYVRPILCRICEFPVAQLGSRVVDLDLEKLRRWWLYELETEFDDNTESTENHDWICQFCIWDARYKWEDDELADGDWWTGSDTDLFYEEFYYKKEVIRPCQVEISPIAGYVEDPSLSENESCSTDGTNFYKLNTLKSRKKPTTCIYCEKTFESLIDSIRHISLSHKKFKKFSCPVCHLYFKSINAKKKHIENSHKIYLCHYCRNRQGSVALLREHIVADHGNEIQNRQEYHCCGQSFKGTHDLVTHMVYTSTSKKVECVYCKKFIVALNISNHIKKCHSSLAVKCEYHRCKKYFTSLTQKQQHIAQVHETKTGLVPCLYCTCKFKQSHMNRHVISKHPNRAIRCTYQNCPTFFHTEDERKRHIQKVHLVPIDTDCIYCGKTKGSVMDLHAHIKRFHLTVMFKCKVKGCPKYFYTQGELDAHFLEMHSAEESKKSFVCESCDFRTYTSEYLKKHTLQKHGELKFKCQKCSKMFKSTFALRRHDYGVHRKRMIAVSK